jgi:ankyrin repeat protein
MAADPVLKACWLTKHRQSRAVDLAARKGGADVMIHLLRMGSVFATERALYYSSQGFTFSTPIEIAALEDLPEVVTYLLSRNDMRADVAGATSALHQAAQRNYVECLQALLAPDSPVNTDSLDQYGWYPLHSAAENANLEAVQLLLSRGAVCVVRASNGWTPLHQVCSQSDKRAKRAQILGMLLESGGDNVMNAQDNCGYTPLHWAVYQELPECCELLLRAGSQASLSIQNEFGETP